MLKKHWRQIRPLRIHLLDQGILLVATPAFDFLFARDRVSRIVESLVKDQSINFVDLRESFYSAVLMLPDSSH